VLQKKYLRKRTLLISYKWKQSVIGVEGKPYSPNFVIIKIHVYIGYIVKDSTQDSQHLFCVFYATFFVSSSLKNSNCVRNAG